MVFLLYARKNRHVINYQNSLAKKWNIYPNISTLFTNPNTIIAHKLSTFLQFQIPKHETNHLQNTFLHIQFSNFQIYFYSFAACDQYISSHNKHYRNVFTRHGGGIFQISASDKSANCSYQQHKTTLQKTTLITKNVTLNHIYSYTLHLPRYMCFTKKQI